MKNLRQYIFATCTVLFVASLAGNAFAGDPPSRVARLKYISGDVSMQPGGVDDWAAATINRPMTTADRLWADQDARAELHLGSAAIRIDSQTSLTLSNLNDNTVQLELDQGTLNLQIARLFNGEIYEVDTPNAAFTILKAGSYRFDVDSNGDNSVVTVWKGRVVATGNGQAVRVDSNHQARFMGGMSLAHAMYRAPQLDGFDQWCQVRADREARAISARYVSADVIGYEDLDEYGTWRPVPSYGTLWFPTRVAAGWAPYRYGHWVWIEPWGWTWVDDASWGFAPFHYGRWVFISGSWAWAPGPVSVRPCYAPALVAWVGSSGAGIGWFPLGYGEPYIPYYHVSRTYFETVNVSNTRITNITYVTNTYYNVNDVHITNIHYVHETSGITIVNNDVLVNSRRVDHDVIIDRDHDRNWRDHRDGWVTAGPPISPSHRAVVGVVDYHRTQQPPDRILNRRVVENVKPPQRPVRFDDKHDELEARRGRPLDSDEEDRMRRRIPAQHRPDRPGDRDTQADNDRGRGAQPGDDRHSGDRDRRDSAGNDGRDASNNGHGPAGHGDDEDRQNARWSNNSDQRRRDHDGNCNDGNDHRADSFDNSRNNNTNSNGQRSDDSNWRRQFPRPPRRGNDDQGQQSAGGMNNPDAHQGNQNSNDDKGQRANSGDNSRNNNPNSNGQRSDDSNSRRQFPHPPRRGNDDQGQQSAGMNNADPHQANQNSNDDRGQRANSGDNSRNNPNSSGSDQRTQTPGNEDRGRSADRNNSLNQNGNSAAPQAGDSNAARTFPRPPRVDTDRARTSPSQQDGSIDQNSGRNASVSNEQGGSGIRGRGPDRAERPVPPGFGNNNSGSNPSQPAVHEATRQPSSDSSVTRSPAPPASPAEARHDNPSSDRQMNRPSSSDRGSYTPPPQQAERSQPRPQNDPRPAGAPQRAAAPQRTAPAESHGSANKDSGSTGNSRGASGFQDRDHGKVQDR